MFLFEFGGRAEETAKNLMRDNQGLNERLKEYEGEE
jgi:hypothetical protein